MVFSGHCIDQDGWAIDISEADVGWFVDDARKRSAVSESNRALMEMMDSLEREDWKDTQDCEVGYAN